MHSQIIKITIASNSNGHPLDSIYTKTRIEGCSHVCSYVPLRCWSVPAKNHHDGFWWCYWHTIMVLWLIRACVAYSFVCNHQFSITIITIIWLVTIAGTLQHTCSHLHLYGTSLQCKVDSFTCINYQSVKYQSVRMSEQSTRANI